MAIYTKKGDRGTTSIIHKLNGKTVNISKASTLIDAIGAVDEVNSYLGIIVTKVKSQKSKVKIQKARLEEVQRDLFRIGAILAGASFHFSDFECQSEKLEREIDKMERVLPKLTGFILPGGSEIGAHLMYARTLARKAERRIVGLQNKLAVIYRLPIIKYLNRLSDYLFVLARWINFKSTVKETRWVG